MSHKQINTENIELGNDGPKEILTRYERKKKEMSYK